MLEVESGGAASTLPLVGRVKGEGSNTAAVVIAST
jgi:hypothetical protein